MKLSIRSRLILSFVAVIVLVLVCQLGFNLFFAKNYYRTYQENRMYSAYAQVEAAFDGSSDSVELAVSSYENNNNIEVLVWLGETLCYTSYDRLFYEDNNPIRDATIAKPSGNAQTGQVQLVLETSTTQGASSNVAGKGQKAPQEDAQAGAPQEDAQAGAPQEDAQVGAPQAGAQAGVPQEGEVTATAQDAQSGAELLRLVDTFEYQGEVVTVAISLSLDSIESSADVFSRSSMLISIIALILGLVYSLILSRSITKPILEMDQIAGELANLDFSRKANETVSSTELYHLSKSINSMSEQLEKAIQALNVANAQLQQDIDYQKQMEQMRREFVGNVSHEMKTPLTMLQIYAESLKYNIESVDKDYYCDTIMEETETLNDLVASMLDISSIESGLCKMQMDELVISDLLASLVARMQPMLAAYHVTSTIAPDLALLGDEKYLEQAMKNYITNAIEHTPEGGDIVISLIKENEGVCYCVENQGKQIAEAEMPRLWDSFYRSDKARSRSNKNVGLGLHIVKTVVEKHEGTCACENTADGVRFSFWIPDRVLLQENDAN